MKRQYIKTTPIYDKPKQSRDKKAEQKDKEARLYALAEKLNVKIGVSK